MKNYFLNQRTVTFLIALLIASGLWLLIKLSGNFQTEHKIRIGYQNFPIDRVLINKPDSVLKIRTNNNGFGVLGQLVFARNKSLTLDFKTARFLRTRAGVQTYYILCSSLQSSIKDEFKSADQILNIQPDSLIFVFEKLASKKLKIQAQITLSFDPRFKQYKKMILEPDSLVFFGPASILESLTAINTYAFDLQNINTNIDTVIPLHLPNNKLISNRKNVKFQLAVEEYTEGKISLPIQLEADTETQYKIFPSEVQVTYQVALKDYAKINSSDFELLATPDSTEAGKLLLQLSKQPKNVIVSNIQPASAEYIILR